jgi:hypothetical protein
VTAEVNRAARLIDTGLRSLPSVTRDTGNRRDRRPPARTIPVRCLRHVPEACSGAAHATSSTASQGAAATAVGVIPAKVMTSRWRWDWSA